MNRATRWRNRLIFECPGCGNSKAIPIEPLVGYEGPVWSWNGSLDRPTLAPSILVQGTVPITDSERDRILAGEKIEPRALVCHSFVRDGRIEYLGDCTHALKGQTVDLPEIAEAAP